MITKYNIQHKIALSIFILGITLLLYPLLEDKFNETKHSEFISEQMEIIKQDIEKEEIIYPSINNNNPSVDNTPDENIKEDEVVPAPVPLNKYDRLYNDMKKYNEELYKIGQQNLLDPFMFEVPTIKLSDYEIPSDIFGYISIPDINIELPIYLGATKENMKYGATYLATTSYPVGGNNTNTVICAHRGYKTEAMFRNIDRLEVGDEITITNYWEVLTYKVTSKAVIYPDEVQNVFIQEGKDMLTLSTCHPLRYNYQRYIVYCERVIN